MAVVRAGGRNRGGNRLGGVAGVTRRAPVTGGRTLLRRSGVLLLAFAGLTLSVHAGLWRPVDQPALFRAATEAPCEVLRFGFAVSPWLSAQYTVVYALLAALVAYRRTRRWQAVALLAGLLATAPVELAAKLTVDQPLPRQTFDLRRPECGPEGYGLATVATPHSYPSGSVTRLVYFATLGALFAAHLERRRRRAARLAIAAGALAFALTRVPIGWHWPSDVAGAALLGAGVACLAVAVAGNRSAPPPRGGDVRDGRAGAAPPAPHPAVA